jgi:hypothetical protein
MNKLQRWLLAGASLFLIGCSTLPRSNITSPIYKYSGMVGDDYVETGILEGNVKGMKVTKPDGIVKDYIDLNNDLRVERVIKTEKDGSRKTANINDELGSFVIEDAQRQFDYYLSQIKNFNVDKGIADFR